MVQSGNRTGLRWGICFYTVWAGGPGDDAKQARYRYRLSGLLGPGCECHFHNL